MAAIQRQVARKLWISQISGASFVKQEGWNPSYVEVGGKPVSRVNILATVVGRFLSEDGNYGALTLDDGTDTIRSKAFGPDVKLVKSVTVGNMVRFVGRVKMYGDEMYLAPEAVRRVDDPNWLTVQKLKLGKAEPVRVAEQEQKEASQDTIAEALRAKSGGAEEARSGTKRGKAKEESSAPEEKPAQEENYSAKIVKAIKSIDAGKGAPITDVIRALGVEESEAKNLIASLLASGELFEPKKGMLKVLD